MPASELVQKLAGMSPQEREQYWNSQGYDTWTDESYLNYRGTDMTKPKSWYRPYGTMIDRDYVSLLNQGYSPEEARAIATDLNKITGMSVPTPGGGMSAGQEDQSYYRMLDRMEELRAQGYSEAEIQAQLELDAMGREDEWQKEMHSGGLNWLTEQGVEPGDVAAVTATLMTGAAGIQGALAPTNIGGAEALSGFGFDQAGNVVAPSVFGEGADIASVAGISAPSLTPTLPAATLPLGSGSDIASLTGISAPSAPGIPGVNTPPTPNAPTPPPTPPPSIIDQALDIVEDVAPYAVATGLDMLSADAQADRLEETAERNQEFWEENAYPRPEAVKAYGTQAMDLLANARAKAYENVWDKSASRGFRSGTGQTIGMLGDIEGKYIKSLGQMATDLFKFANTPQFAPPGSTYYDSAPGAWETGLSSGGNWLDRALGYQMLSKYFSGD